VAGALFLSLLALCLPKTLLRLHADRAGNHAAGLWLRHNAEAWDHIEDDHCWSHFYAGSVFLEDQPAAIPCGTERRWYDVITRSRDAQVSETRHIQEQEIQSRGGRLTYHWPEGDPVENARVVVYERPWDGKANLKPTAGPSSRTRVDAGAGAGRTVVLRGTGQIEQ
jgi:hypothetical protein